MARGTHTVGHANVFHAGNARTTAQQELLLEALLLDEADALEAWRAWSAGLDLKTLDRGSTRLLPLLYQRLSALHVDRSALDSLRAEYIDTWRANQLRLHQLREAVGHVQAAGIPVMLLKGAALIVSNVSDPGVRPMADCDLLVPYAMASRSVDLLLAAGWKTCGAQPHAQPLTHASGCDLDLHWNVFAERGGQAVDEPFWQAAEQAALADTPVFVLCPADQLLHVCVHGAIWSPTPGIRWIADAVLLVKRTPHMDWDRLVAQAHRCRLSLFAGTTLRYLRDRFRVAIPEDIVRRLEAVAIAKAERTDFERQTISTDCRPLLREAWTIGASYVRWTRARRRVPSPGGLVRYLADRYMLDTTWKLPHYAASRLARRLLELRHHP